MNRWERLTPLTEEGYTPVDYYRNQQPLFHHQLRRASDSFVLSDPELLALAQRCPEVQALVEAARSSYDQDRPKCRYCTLDNPCDAHGQLHDALAPFEE